MARFAGLGLEPILADSDDDDGDMGFRRAGFGVMGAAGDRRKGGGNDPMSDTWQNEVGNIKVNDRGMRVAQRDGEEELLLEGQVVPDQLVFGDGRVIGRGACSVVNLARHKDTGQLFAVKVFSLLDREKRRQLDREIGTLLRSLENGCCSQLVDFFGAFKRPDGSIRVVLEYMDRGSLADVMEYRSAIQSRWTERREAQLNGESRPVAGEPWAGGSVLVQTASRLDAGSFAPRVRSGSSFAADGSERGSGGRPSLNAGDRLESRAETDDEDDMPATLERLGAPHRSNGVIDARKQHKSNYSGSQHLLNSSRYRGHSSSNSNGGGTVSGGGGGGNAAAHGWPGSDLHDRWPEELQLGYPLPSRIDSDVSSFGPGTPGKPPPLSVGACKTPSDAFPEQERGKVDAPWTDYVDHGTGSRSELGAPGSGGHHDHENAEAFARRRVDAAAELQRQKEQEEWDRAFEEELVQTGLPEDVVAACVYQILAGLTYLHEHNQLHRDVKPSNILLNARGEVKLTDFGIARELDHAGAMVETVVGTVRYMSPERLHGEAYGRPADVWGLGLVMIECVTQEAPYADGCSQIEILQTLKEHGGSGLLPSGLEDRVPLSDAFVAFVSNCLKVKPEDRLSTAELLNSRWFVEQGVHGREEAVELMSEYLEGLYGPHAFKYFGDGGTSSQARPAA